LAEQTFFKGFLSQASQMRKKIPLLLAVLGSAAVAGCSILPDSPPPAERILIDPEPLPFLSSVGSAKKRAVWVWVEDPQAETFLETSNVLLRPTPHTLGIYEGVAWVYPPGRVLKKALIKSLTASHRFKGVGEAFQPTALPLSKVFVNLDAFWVDYTVGAVPCARIKGTLRLEQDFSGASSTAASLPFDIKIPLQTPGKKAVFQGFEEAVKQWSQTASQWIDQTHGAK
jgi:ABC-type uncharacterized transport system auxiliary subunit